MALNTPEDYINQLPDNRKEAMVKLRKTIQENLPEGFEETIQNNMIAYVVPHKIYPPGYHSKPELALPFIHLASQKSHIALYHMGLYTNKKLLEWFTQEYSKRSSAKLDMGKSCLRFKKPEHIPYELIGELASKITPEEWIKTYETNIKR